MKEKTRLTHINKKMLLILLLVTGASCLLVFFSYIFGDRVLAFKDIGSDTTEQYLGLYASISEKIRTGDWTLWNVDNGFGTNLYMCNLFNPLLWILYIIGAIFGFNVIPGILVWWFILEILLAAAAAYIYLSVFDLPEYAKVPASYMYAFNGFLIVWGQHYQFGIICIILPLLLWSIERHLRDRKCWPMLTIMTAVCVLNSMYLAYMSLLVCGFYVILRILMHENNKPLAYICRVVKTALPMILGVVMGMVSLLPSFVAIKSASNRLSGGFDWGFFLRNFFDEYPRLYYKTVVDRLISSAGEGINLFHGFLNYYEAPALFFSGLFLFLGAQYVLSIPFQKVGLKAKIMQAVFLVLAGASMYFTAPGIIFNGFTDPFCRYTFLLMPYFLLIAAFSLKRILTEKKVNLPGIVIVLAIMAWRYRIMILCEWHNPKKILMFTFCCCVVMAVCLVLYRFIRNQRLEQVILFVLAVSLAGNVSADSFADFHAREALKKDDAYYAELEDKDTLEALKMISDSDDGLFRVEKMYGATYGVDALYQNYQGVSAYNSVQNGNIIDYINADWHQISFLDKNHLKFSRGAGNTAQAELTGVRYILAKTSGLKLKDYEIWQQVGDVFIYKNDTIDGICSYYDEDTVSTAGNEITVDSMLMDEDAVLDFRKMLKDDIMKGQVTVETDGYLVAAIPYENGWSVSVDGESVPLLQANIGFQAVKLTKGTHDIIFKFDCPTFKESMLISLAGLLVFAAACVISKKKRG